MPTVRSILIGFFAIIVYYGFYYAMTPFIGIFANTHSNTFDVLMVLLIPLIIFGVIVFSSMNESEDYKYR